MAREQITHNRIVDRQIASPTYTDPDHPGNKLEAIVHVEVPRRNVHVQWNRTGVTDAAGLETGWLQLGIDITVSEIRDLLKHAEEEAQAAKAGNAAFGEYDTEKHPVRVFSDVLSRAEVNKAVTALRRGRDVAYGKDA